MKHEIETRPWGTYEILLDSEKTKVKKLQLDQINVYHINIIINVLNIGL
jgi:hypothetical protein